jgi:hypothetical protein
MTREQLAALPVGAKIRLWVDRFTVGDETVDVYEFGEIVVSGAVVTVAWEGNNDTVSSFIDTKSPTWDPFVRDIDEDPNKL